MRLFVALGVPEVVSGRIDAALSGIRHAHPELRWSDPGTWHLTLAFVGEVDEDTTDAAVAATRAAAAAAGPIEVTLGGAGRFGQGVLWLGLTDQAYAAVVAVGERLRDELARRDVSFDAKALHPHLTLARARHGRSLGVSRSKVRAVDAALADLPTRSWTATRIEVIRSGLTPQRAVHTTVAAVALAGPPSGAPSRVSRPARRRSPGLSP